MLSSADCRRTRHALTTAFVHGGPKRGVPISSSLPWLSLDEGDALLVLVVPLMVLLLFSGLAGLGAVICHLEFNKRESGGCLGRYSPMFLSLPMGCCRKRIS